MLSWPQSMRFLGSLLSGFVLAVSALALSECGSTPTTTGTCLPGQSVSPAEGKRVVLYDGGTPSDPADDISYCLPGCKHGTQPNELDKCRGRIDLVCSESAAGSASGYCRPACRSNIDCGARVCDLKTGLCGDGPATGDPIGASCDVTASTCGGGCIEHGGAFNECSGVCRHGPAGGGQTNTAPPPAH